MPLAAPAGKPRLARLFADQMAEGLAAMKAAGITPVSATPIPPNWTPTLLRLPDAIFNAILGRTMKIDPEARSSMWQDLKQGREDRDRLSPGRDHRARRTERRRRAAVAPHCCADQGGRSGRQRTAPVDAAADPGRGMSRASRREDDDETLFDDRARARRSLRRIDACSRKAADRHELSRL